VVDEAQSLLSRLQNGSVSLATENKPNRTKQTTTGKLICHCFSPADIEKGVELRKLEADGNLVRLHFSSFFRTFFSSFFFCGGIFFLLRSYHFFFLSIIDLK